MATEVKRRRGTAAQVAAATPNTGEVVVDTDNSRLVVGNGMQIGGFPTPNAQDAQKQSFTRLTVGGTADAITLTSPAPARAAYATGEKVCWIQSGANTTAVTINRDAVGAKSVKKNVTEALAADDLKNGGYYEAVYDGTNYQITNAAAGASGEVFVASVVASASASMILAVGSGYDHYVLNFWARPATDGVYPTLEFSVDGGSTYLTTLSVNVHDLATATILSPANNRLITGTSNPTLVGNAAGRGVSVSLDLGDLDGAQVKRFAGSILWSDVTGDELGGPIRGADTTQSAVTHIRIKFNSGNITAGWAGLNAKRRT